MTDPITEHAREVADTLMRLGTNLDREWSLEKGTEILEQQLRPLVEALEKVAGVENFGAMDDIWYGGKVTREIVKAALAPYQRSTRHSYYCEICAKVVLEGPHEHDSGHGTPTK